MATEPAAAQPDRYSTATAVLLRGYEVQVTLQNSLPGKGFGPWSFMVDEGPLAGSVGGGPPPVILAVGALAA